MSDICPNCKGKGYIIARYPVTNIQELLFCHACGGSGHIPQEEPMKDTNVLEIDWATDGRGTTAILIADDPAFTMVGVGRCRKDQYDRHLGLAIAMLKMSTTPSVAAMEFSLEIYGGAERHSVLEVPAGLLIHGIAGLRAALDRNTMGARGLVMDEIDKRHYLLSRMQHRNVSSITERWGRDFRRQLEHAGILY